MSATVIVAGTILDVPSKLVPPIVLALARAVAVAASPTAMFDVPSKLVPPIVRAVSRAVAVAAFPVVDPDEPLTFPVTFPVIFPANVLVSTPVDALYVRPPSVFGAKSPVADSHSPTEQLESVVSATVIVPGTMLAVPLKLVPPIVLAVSS